MNKRKGALFLALCLLLAGCGQVRVQGQKRT